MSEMEGATVETKAADTDVEPIIKKKEIEPMTDENTLVRYENPILIKIEKGQKNIMRPMNERPVSPGFPQIPNIPGLTGPSTGGQDPILTKTELDNILQVIFPPLEWEENEKYWQQKVFSGPAARNDIVLLEEKLDIRLIQQQVRPTGIYPIRHDLYLQCFDELVRQVTVDCAERGLLLQRLRDEIRMTMAAYQAIVDNAIIGGQKAANAAELLVARGEANVQAAVHRKEKTEWAAQDLAISIELLERKHYEKKKAEERRHAEELKLLKLSNQQLQSLLDSILAFNKKS